MPILDIKKDVSYCVGSFAAGLDHPECVAWGSDGFAYAGGEAGQLYRIDVGKNRFEQFSQAPQFVGGLCQDGSGFLYVCSGNKVYRCNSQGELEVYSEGTVDEPMIAPNYPAFDKNGCLYVSDSGVWGDDNGRIFKIHPGKITELWSETPKEFPNGLCISPDGLYLYVVVSLNDPRVERIKINSDGSAGYTELVLEIPNSVPDGLAFDSDGNLFISCYRPDSIFRFTTDQNLEIIAHDYEGTMMAAPTNIAFCGENLDDLLSSNLGRWHISRYDLKVSGHPLNYPIVK